VGLQTYQAVGKKKVAGGWLPQSNMGVCMGLQVSNKWLHWVVGSGPISPLLWVVVSDHTSAGG